MSRIIQKGDFLLDDIFDLIVGCGERVVVDEDGAIGRDSFGDCRDGLQKRAQGMDTCIECGVDGVAELNEDCGVAERLEHVSA